MEKFKSVTEKELIEKGYLINGTTDSRWGLGEIPGVIVTKNRDGHANYIHDFVGSLRELWDGLNP